MLGDEETFVSQKIIGLKTAKRNCQRNLITNITRTTMFKPIRPNKVALSYSDENRSAKKHVPLRMNNPRSSFPSFRHSSDDLSALDQLPVLENPEPLPGDCKVKEFILEKVTPYHGDASFLEGPTERTLKSWQRCEELMEEELKRGGVLDVDTHTASTITSHAPGYVLSKEEDVILGLQTDEPLKRSCKPKGGFSVVRKALESYGYKPDPAMKKTYTEVRFATIFGSSFVDGLSTNHFAFPIPIRMYKHTMTLSFLFTPRRCEQPAMPIC